MKSGSWDLRYINKIMYITFWGCVLQGNIIMVGAEVIPIANVKVGKCQKQIETCTVVSTISMALT